LRWSYETKSSATIETVVAQGICAQIRRRIEGDMGRPTRCYIYQRMQAENATQVAAQAALKACWSQLPATQNCSSTLTTAVSNALKSTSLGTNISLISGSPSEGYYCVNSSNALQLVSNVTSPKPADCTAAGMPSLQPGDYIQVQTTFPYTPLFPGLSVSSTFPTPINRTAIMRLG
jgi:hypothetical protein